MAARLQKLAPLDRKRRVDSLDWLRGSILSVGSIGSAGSLLSIGSAGSLTSILSAGARSSLLSAGTKNAALGRSMSRWHARANAAAFLAVGGALLARELSRNRVPA